MWSAAEGSDVADKYTSGWRLCWSTSIGHRPKSSANIVGASELKQPTACCVRSRRSRIRTILLSASSFLGLGVADAKRLGLGALVVDASPR